MKHVRMERRATGKSKKCCYCYEGFSLVEMLITMVIMMIVMLMVSVTFSTMVTTSIRSDLKLKARDEADIGLELMKKFLRQADAEEIFVYQSGEVRGFDPESAEVFATVAPTAVVASYVSAVPEGDSGNEVHIRPNGSDRWICFGWFQDSDGGGSLVKSSGEFPLDRHENCFDSSKMDYRKNTIILNSDDVDFKSFAVRYYKSNNINSMITAELESIPSRWIGKGEPKSSVRQVVVSTGKLTIQ